MANITITVPNEHIPRIKAAWEFRFVRNEGESDVDFFRRGVAELVKNVVRQHESQQVSINVDDVAS